MAELLGHHQFYPRFADRIEDSQKLLQISVYDVLLYIHMRCAMKVSMADVNKRGNMIINQVVDTGEPAIIVKHGRPIAEIRPLPGSAEREQALSFLSTLEPVVVSTSLEQVVEEGRKRGL
jgi:antitoxin (DNA-binding transcriptional repressor) of toxin-antitoxin stability system